MSDTCMDRSAGTWAAARRCSTDAHALLAAVSSAKNTQTTVWAAIGWRCTWIPASVNPRVQPVHGGLSGRRVGVRAEGGERAQVGQALTALLPPGPLPPDGGREAEHQRFVERLVGVAEHAAEQPVDLGLGDGGQRQPSGQVDVAGAVEREVDAVHAGAALKQEAVERRVVLVRLAAEERLNLKAVVPGDQPGHSGELMLSLEADQVPGRGLVLVAQAQAVEDAAEDVGGSGVLLLHRRLTPLPGPRGRQPPRPWHRYTPWPACPRSRTSRKRTRVAGRPPTGPGAAPGALMRRPDDPGPVGRVVPVHQDAGVAVADDGAQAAYPGRDDRGAAGLRLQRHQPERLRVGGGEHQRGRPVPLRELGLRARRLQPHVLADPEVRGQLAHPVRVRPLLPSARPADENHPQLARAARGSPR